METEKVGFFRKLGRIFSKKQILALIGIAIAAIVGALLESAVVALMLPFMNAIMGGQELTGNGYLALIARILGSEDQQKLIVSIAILMAVLYVIKGVYGLCLSLIQYRFLSRTNTHISAKLLDKILHKPYAYHLSRTQAETQRAVTWDVDRLMGLISALLSVFTQIFTALALLAVLMVMDPKLTLFAAALIVIILLIVNKLVVKKITQAGKDNQAQNTEMIRWVYYAMGGLKGILTNRRQQLFINGYAESARKYAETNSRRMALSAIPRTVVETIAMLGVFLAVAVMAAGDGDLTGILPVMAAFALAAVRLIPVANQINGNLNQARYNMAALDSVYKTLTENEISQKDTVSVRPVRPLPKVQPLQTGVEVKDLSFRFPDAEQALYEHIDLSVPTGKSVALVGPSGSGKTTLADLILGLHKPESGVILADGRDISQDPDWWADQIGYIPQSIYLCSGTVRDNVAFGMAPEHISDERVWDCLRQAQMEEFIRGLPDGLDTKCGDRGVRFSGGQRQRIGIARALYTDPALLVLDEATSSLDTETEQAIMDAIHHLKGKKTLVIIAHRLSTIADCDMIYEIADGKITRQR
ncbi:MAG: ABC transporter ATP-binding protein [Oscillospiraceae bacterium]|nr:ABC transporter ATP-binding protein [Oscillospiraceae bacterium]